MHPTAGLSIQPDRRLWAAARAKLEADLHKKQIGVDRKRRRPFFEALVELCGFFLRCTIIKSTSKRTAKHIALNPD